MPVRSFLKRVSHGHDRKLSSGDSISAEEKPKISHRKTSNIISMLPKDLQFHRRSAKNTSRSHPSVEATKPLLDADSSNRQVSCRMLLWINTKFNSTSTDLKSVRGHCVHKQSPVTPSPTTSSHACPSQISGKDDNSMKGPEHSLPTGGPTVVERSGVAFDLLMAELNAANKILEQRHANIKVTADISKKDKPADIDGIHPSNSIRHPHFRSFSADSPHRPLPPTANTATADRRRRELVKQIAYDAYYHHCPTAIRHMESIVARFVLQDRHPEHRPYNVYVNVKGQPLEVSAMGNVERNWAHRLNACIALHKKLERRAINADDHELIVSQLFPFRNPFESFATKDYFEIFLGGLVKEGTISDDEAKNIARLAVSQKEFECGGFFTGPIGKATCRHDPTSHRMFEMPKHDTRGEFYRPYAVDNWAPDLESHLKMLAQAAEIKKFYEAWKISSQDKLLPPYLTKYKRHWRNHNVVTLKRAYLVCRLLDDYEAGKIKDFGIINAIRGSLLHIQGQRGYLVEELESFLYHRVSGTGLSVSTIPHILALHWENDEWNGSPRHYPALVQKYEKKAKQFIEEEEERLSKIESSKHSFDLLLKSEMNSWQRVKAKCKKVFGKKVTVAPFDPFAPEHDLPQD